MSLTKARITNEHKWFSRTLFNNGNSTINNNGNRKEVTMSEITKLYKNAEIKSVGFNTYRLEDEYPPFTAEKQIELIKYFSNNYNISINKDNNIFRFLFINKDGIHNFYTSGVDFAEQLALFVISRYKNQILTEEERKQIKEILE